MAERAVADDLRAVGGAQAPSSRVDAADHRLRELTGHLNVLHAGLVEVTTELIELKDVGAWGARWVAHRRAVPRLEGRRRARHRPQAGGRRRTCSRVPGSDDRPSQQVRSPSTRSPSRRHRGSRPPPTPTSAASRQQTTVSQLRRIANNYSFDDLAQPGAASAAGDVDAAEAPPASEEDNGAAGDADTIGDVHPEAAAHAAADSGSGGMGAAAGFDEGLLGFGFDDLRRFTLYLTGGDADTGRLIEAALSEARDRLWNESAGAAGEPADVSWIDALRDVCLRSLAFDGSTSRSDRYRLHLHLDTDASASDALGWRLPDAIARYLSCDGLLLPTFVADGVPFSVGRAQHITPLRTRIQVLRRDGGCRVPGCRATHGLEIHHIIHWDDDGPTDTWNLVALCPRHHRLHHRGLLGITGNADLPDGVRFTNARGRLDPTFGSQTDPTGRATTATHRSGGPIPPANVVNSRWISLGGPRPTARSDVA